MASIIVCFTSDGICFMLKQVSLSWLMLCDIIYLLYYDAEKLPESFHQTLCDSLIPSFAP